MTTLLLGRIKTCLFPRFSALYIDFRASPSTLMRTILVDLRAEQRTRARCRERAETLRAARAVSRCVELLMLSYFARTGGQRAAGNVGDRRKVCSHNPGREQTGNEDPTHYLIEAVL